MEEHVNTGGDVSTTYLDIPFLRLEICQLTPTSPEDQLYGIWCTIMFWMFPPMAGFFIWPQAFRNENGEPGHYFEFYTFERTGGGREFFLLAHCVPATDGCESAFAPEALRLGNRMRACIGNRPQDLRSPVYGILAVGRGVIFFRYDDEAEAAAVWRPFPGSLTYFDLENHAHEIQEVLNYILSTH